VILAPERAEIEKRQIQTIKFGTGIVLDVLNYSLIDNVIKDSPAEKAGVKAKDQITTINDIPVGYLSEQEVFYLLEGTQERQIKLGLKRLYDHFELSFSKVSLRTSSFRKKLLVTENKKEILYLKVDDLLSSEASFELEKILNLAKQKQVENLVLDLRDNKGGLLENAIRISEFFLEPGEIILKIKSSWGEKIIKAQEKALYRKKLVVLINEETASSSEIIAGSLKDNHRSKTIGLRSFGKGFAQRVRELPDGSLMHITVSKFFRPSGRQIDKLGVLPEIEINSSGVQILKAIEYLSLEN